MFHATGPGRGPLHFDMSESHAHIGSARIGRRSDGLTRRSTRLCASRPNAQASYAALQLFHSASTVASAETLGTSVRCSANERLNRRVAMLGFFHPPG
ncbi:hypothetical protein PSAB6_10253 [Paraburkholderia sabiae]|nr:hypothetical protein PSAB6_10253 [Paraburkholderia sabiae]